MEKHVNITTTNIVLAYSFTGGVGRTTAVVQLGYALAKRGKRVLLVDFDLRDPNVTRYLAESGKCSFSGSDAWKTFPGVVDSVAHGHKELPSCIQDTGIPGLFVLPAGDCTPQGAPVLADFGQRLGFWRWPLNNLKAAVQGQFDYVLVDAPSGDTPITEELLTRLADAVLFVGNWSASNFERGLARLSQAVQKQRIKVVPLVNGSQTNEVDMRQAWMTGTGGDHKGIGYQPLLRQFYTDNFGVPPAWLEQAMRPVPFVAHYAYGHPLGKHSETDPLLPPAHYRRLAIQLAG
jgi:Mrp family chromosome partitioning ATPase